LTAIVPFLASFLNALWQIAPLPCPLLSFTGKGQYH